MSKSTSPMFRYLITLAAFLCTGFAGMASAHIKNDASQFPDIEFSDARYDIVLLVGAGIIPETPVFEPDAPFTLNDLAVWAALYKNLGEGGETPDTEALAKAALEQGLVSSLEGPADYAGINSVFFGDMSSIDPAAPAPTRAAAAQFIAAHLSAPEGAALLEQRGLRPGPAGEVGQVETRTNPDGGSSYFITIAGTTLPMYSHGRVANGPTDLLQWQGRQIRKSFIRSQGDLELWMYLEAEPVAVSTAPAAGQVVDTAAPAPVESNNELLYGLIAGVLVLGVLLFTRRKRVGS